MNRKESSSPATSSLTTSRLHLRDLIIDTAMSMFKQRGIKSVTMDELSSRMGISKRTLYELFEDKETLLVKVWGWESEAVENNVEVYVGFLRKKLAALGSKVKIKAQRSLGYHLEAGT